MEPWQSQLSIRCAQRSEAGIKPVNEDSIGIRVPEGALLAHKGVIAVIADGVSAAESGREASQTCVQNLLYDYYCTPDTWTAKKSVLTVLEALNRWLFSQGMHLENSEKGHVTTLSVLVLKSTTAHVFHVGDSRIFRWRRGELQQLTEDHVHRLGGHTYLARAMGLDSRVQVDYQVLPLEKGDMFLLVTDGLYRFVDAAEVAAIIASAEDMEAKVNRLYARAMAAGSDDNLSLQLLLVDDLAEPSETEIMNRMASLPFPPLLQPGQVLDGLQVERILYESNRSQLYVVKDGETGTQYVMKTPSVNFADDAAYITRFATELWLGRKMRHSKLVHIVTPHTEPSCLYYLMEYVDGVTLAEWMMKRPNPSMDAVVHIARQIALGLRALHRQQVIHQDLKPGNIMIDDNEQIKLVDYGSCSLVASNELPKSIKAEQALGTATYSAPECHLGQPIAYSADVFSLAAILYEMLTGKLPYQGRMENGLREGDLEKLRYQPASEINRYVPYWFDMALKKALAIHPQDRYSDIDEFIYDLEHPNPRWLKPLAMPLAEQNPLLVWKLVAATELFIILLLLLVR